MKSSSLGAKDSIIFTNIVQFLSNYTKTSFRPDVVMRRQLAEMIHCGPVPRSSLCMGVLQRYLRYMMMG